MAQQRQKAARRPLVSFPWIGTRLLIFFFLFYGSVVVLLGVCAARAGVGAAAAYARAYQHGRQRARDRVYGSRFWTDACVLEHTHGLNSNLSHYNVSVVPARAVSKDVCTLSYGQRSVTVEEPPQAMAWASATVNASMQWLKLGSLAVACAGPRGAVVPLLLSTSGKGVCAADDERWLTMARKRLDGVVERLERNGGPYPGVEVVGKCLRWWDTSVKAYDFMRIEGYDETSKKHKCRYIDGYKDGGRGSGEYERIDLLLGEPYLDIISCKEEFVGLTMKLYEGMCSETYKEGQILLYDESTDEFVMKFPDDTEERHVLEVHSIQFCDVPRDMEVCPYGGGDPCENECENDCEMEDEGYEKGDYVEVKSVEDPEAYYPAIVQGVRLNGRLYVRYQGVGPNGKERESESNIDPARVRYQPEGSEDGSEHCDGECTVYKSGDDVEVLKNGKYYAATVARVRDSDGRLAVYYKRGPGVEFPPGKASESGVELSRVRWPTDGEDDAEDVAYKRNDRVEVLQWVDGEVQEVDGDWLPGKLGKQRVTDCAWHVIYDDGETETGVPESRIRRPEGEGEDPVDPLLNTCVLENMDHYDAMKTYLEGIEMPGGKNAYKFFMETTDSYLTTVFEHHVVISQETDCFTNMRSAAPTFMMQKRCTKWALQRCEAMNNPSFKPKNKKASDVAAKKICSLLESLGVTSKYGTVQGPFRDVAHATYRVRHGQLTNVKRGAGWHLGTDTTCLIYKGVQMAVRSGHLSPWIRERVSCTFAKYSMTQDLALDWGSGFFGDEKLCDACQYPRDAKARNWDLLQAPLKKGAVMYVGVSGANYIKHALKRNSEGLNPPMFIGDVFDASDYDASASSLAKIATQGRSAPDGYWEKFVARHRVGALLYEALDDAGQIPPLKPHGVKPVFEINQLVVALNVGNGLYRGTTDVAKGVEVAFVVDKFFYGNAHTFEYMKEWDDSWQMAKDFKRLADVASFDELTLAPLPTKEGYVIDYGAAGFQEIRWLPAGRVASSLGGGLRVKRKREEREMREMRCYRHADCSLAGKPFPIYCPRDGVWPDDDVLESTIGNGVRCPTCGRRGCELV